MENKDLMEKIVSLAKRRGFIYPGSEIYGGLAGTWDFGPLGVALKNNIKNSWRKKFIESREDMYEFDAALLMNSRVWETSGHVGGFADPLITCLECNKRYRTDSLIEERLSNYYSLIEEKQIAYQDLIRKFETQYPSKKSSNELATVDSLLAKFDSTFHSEEGTEKSKKLLEAAKVIVNDLRAENDAQQKDIDEMGKIDKEIEESFSYIGEIPKIFLNRFINCPNCQKRNWSKSEAFNMMFKTQVGAREESSSTVYFRPETAQGMFVNFKNILDSFAPKLPFGMAQIGKAFRNEITPKDFIFRVREFEQMEIEYFIRAPKEDSEWQSEFEKLRVAMLEWIDEIGIDSSKVHELKVEGADLAHYSKATTDFEFDFPFGRKELYGLAYRTDFDLKAHSEASGVKLEYFDQDGETEADKRFIPHVIEPSFGVERSVLAVLTSAYKEDIQGDEARSYLAFKPNIAPIVCAVSPLLKNRPELQEKAREVFKMLKSEFGRVMYDDNGNVGKRYRRQDEIGTPWCVVVDFDTAGLGDNINPEFKDTVTVRDRDTGEQKRVHINELVSYFKSLM